MTVSKRPTVARRTDPCRRWRNSVSNMISSSTSNLSWDGVINVKRRSRSTSFGAKRNSRRMLFRVILAGVSDEASSIESGPIILALSICIPIPSNLLTILTADDMELPSSRMVLSPPIQPRTSSRRCTLRLIWRGSVEMSTLARSADLTKDIEISPCEGDKTSRVDSRIFNFSSKNMISSEANPNANLDTWIFNLVVVL